MPSGRPLRSRPASPVLPSSADPFRHLDTTPTAASRRDAITVIPALPRPAARSLPGPHQHAVRC